MVAVAIATSPPGPGLDPDAMSYLGAAEWLVHADTYRIPTSSWSAADTTEPLAHFPPGFSTAIAGPVRWGVTPVQSARWLIVLAAFCTWTGIVLIVADVAGMGVALLTGLAALLTPALLNVHLSVLSEPLFLTMLVATLAGMRALARDSHSPGARVALGTGLAVGAAVMLRYAGIALLGAAVLTVVTGRLHTARPWRDRLVRLALLALPTACTLVPWIVRTTHLSGARSVRTLGVYGGLLDTGRGGLQTIANWLAPTLGDEAAGRGRIALALVVLAAAGAIVAQAWRRSARDDRADATMATEQASPEWGRGRGRGRGRALLRTLAILGGCYLALVVASRVLADPDIPLDERILAPVMLLGEIAVATALWMLWRESPRAWRLAVGIVFVVWIAASALVTSGRVAYALDDGNDFAGSDWRESPTIAWVRDPAGGVHRELYTNWPAALYFQAHRSSHDLPRVVDALTVHRFRDRLQRSHGVVVAFDTPSPDVAPPDTLARALGLRTIARFPDGTVWELDSGDRGPR